MEKNATRINEERRRKRMLKNNRKPMKSEHI